MEYLKAVEHIRRWLAEYLPANLYYHGVHHTEDVCEAAERLAHSEGVTGEDFHLLMTAAWLHDSGFSRQYFKNEPVGAEIAREILPAFNYTPAQIEIIAQMILATALPQNPHSHLDQIICDADLDYLGRGDFYTIAHTLKREWDEYGLKKNLREWYEQQVRFVENHVYFTESARRLRNDGKRAYIAEMKDLLQYA